MISSPARQLSYLYPIDEQIKEPNGNKELIEYGVQNDGSDYRIHVGYKTQHIYVFPTGQGKEYISRQHGLELKNAYQDGMVTARGYAVPTSHLKDLREILIPPALYREYIILEKMTTSDKGRLATCIALEMLKKNLVPLSVNVSITDDTTMQVNGTDILIDSKWKIQVKCDFNAGRRDLGGTGNVFLQIEECNPYRRH